LGWAKSIHPEACKALHHCGPRKAHDDALRPMTLSLTFEDDHGGAKAHGCFGYTMEISTYLASCGIRARVLQIGSQGKAHVAVPGSVRAQEHLIANHTFDHTNPAHLLLAGTEISPFELSAQLLHWVACPSKSTSTFAHRMERGTPNIMCVVRTDSKTQTGYMAPWLLDVDGRDWKDWLNFRSPLAYALRYLTLINRRPRRDGIVLLHDSSSERVDEERKNRTYAGINFDRPIRQRNERCVMRRPHN
jgi:peptidoglycan/xylan/chitin deacetylase (PgdA/CDA1 family)